jgi:glycosyltransferase involved in cell wall biosynthesis
MPPPPIRILHIITGLSTGGAERLLQDLVQASEAASFRHEVVSLTGPGPIGSDLAAAGIPVLALGLPSPWRALRGLAPLLAAIRRAELVQTWLYHANVIGGLLAWPVRPVIWSLHATTLDPSRTRLATRLIVRVAALLSPLIPRRIIACADAATAAHLAQGYPAAGMLTIRNGVDTERFRPLPAERARLRRVWDAEADFVVATVARWDPQKDHATLIRAVALALGQVPRLRLLLAGDGMTEANRDLAALIAEAGITNRCILLGRRADVPAILAAADLFVLSSAYGEALPLALCEAMACCLPVVVTDVGDCAAVAGPEARVVPPRAPGALAQAILGWADTLPAELHRIGAAARRRVIANYGVAGMVRHYEACWREVLERSVPAP